MGMYTSLVISARLKPDTPSGIIKTIKTLLDGDLDTEFTTITSIIDGAHRNPLCGASAYFPESFGELRSTRFPNGHTLSVVSNIKNYHSEIEGIIEWLRPHIASGHGQSEWWAIMTYEEDERPTIYYLSEPEKEVG